jgi:hypothetical protein
MSLHPIYADPKGWMVVDRFGRRSVYLHEARAKEEAERSQGSAIELIEEHGTAAPIVAWAVVDESGRHSIHADQAYAEILAAKRHGTLINLVPRPAGPRYL